MTWANITIDPLLYPLEICSSIKKQKIYPNDTAQVVAPISVIVQQLHSVFSKQNRNVEGEVEDDPLAPVL